MAIVAQATSKATQGRKRPTKACANPMFEKWLEEWKQEAQERGLNSVHTYRKALYSLRQYPLPLKDGQEAKKLPNFGDKIAKMLDKKIQEHGENLANIGSNIDTAGSDQTNGVVVSTVGKRTHPSVNGNASAIDPPVTIRQEPLSPAKKRRKINREYVPLHRSGGYAVLVALLKAQQNGDCGDYMVKKDLQKAAQPFCDASFTTPEPGCHYTAWSSVSTLIKKGLLTKSSTVPAKYALTDVGKEMAQKLVNVDSTCVQQPSSSPPQHPPASQETEEVLEASLPRPWLLHQEDGNSGQLSNKQTSISRKKKKFSEKELPPAVLHPFPSNSIPSPSYSDSDDSELLPGDYILNGFSQSSRLSGNSPKFWYVDNDGNFVHEKNKAAILFNSDTFSTSFLIKCQRTDLESSNWHYAIDKSRSCKGDNVHAFISDIDAPELCFPPPVWLTPPYHNVVPTTKPSSSATTTTAVHDHSIVLLSSDSEDDDELPSLAQRIGFATRTTCNGLTSRNCVKQTTVADMNKERNVEIRLEDSQPKGSNHIPATSVTGSKSSPVASCMAGMAALKRHSGHEDVVVITTVPCTSANTKTACCLDSQTSTKPPLTQPSSSLVGCDHSKCSRRVLHPGDYEVILYIDNIEANNKSNVSSLLLSELTKNGIKCKVCKLQIGDFLWVAKPSDGQGAELVLDHIVERKRMDDLCSSIIDRRFAEQKFRLSNCGIHHVIYLIEEFGSSGRFSIPASSLNQAITNTQIIEGFHIQRTQNFQETISYLTFMTRCLQQLYSNTRLEEHSVECVMSAIKQSSPSAAVGSGVVNLMSFSAFNTASVKNKVMTVTEMFAKHIMQIPGFSADKAESMVTRFPTPRSLYEAYEKCGSIEKRPLLLEHIKYGCTNRNLGQSLSTVVHDLYWRGNQVIV
ncbi:crossover junction endonuclease MUS81-like isoform X2 [Dysidea avara]|uniref:crossover junction endonuclease MUS81-like isoform X2 n=1 Tax=Dysidea avara TaxID=196820 RepID=UPI003324D9C5